MTRPLTHLASFFLALLAAHAGLATAGPRTEPAGPAPAISAAFPAPPAAGDDASGQPAAALDPALAWPERISERLAAIARRAEARAGTPGATRPDPRLVELQRRLAAVVRGARVATAVHVEDLDEGTWLFDQRGGARLNPASNHKVITAIAAVELLGADYRFSTRLLRDGDALVLVGEGDPSLQIQALHELASRALAAGAHLGARRIVVDDTAFSPERFGPGYDEPAGAGPSYLAPSGALSLSFNTVEVTVRPRGPGEAPSVELAPASDHVAVVRAGRRRALEVTSACTPEGGTTITVAGPPSRKPTVVRRRICDPARFTGEAFAQVLHELGAERLPVERGAASSDARAVAEHRSAPLAELLASALKYSNNFTSEQVLRTMGWRMRGEPGSWDNGREALAAFWAAAGNDPAALVFENGAGLSLRGRVSPRGLVRVLALTRDEGAPAAALVPALASAGGEGTLRLRMPGGRGRVRGKTGTIGGVSALTGLAATPDGRRALGFSILMNGKAQSARRSRALQDRVVLALLAHLDQGR